MLIVLSGLPGTGKTTIGRELAVKRSAVYIRIDEIEHALGHHLGSQDIGPAGYVIAFAVASSNLKLGHPVVADSVNPVPESRQGWRDVAYGAGDVRILEVEVICSDRTEHKRRVEQRASDIAGFTLPDWPSVESHHYVPWATPRLIVDTARLTVLEAVSLIEERLEGLSRSSASASAE